jgi:hypothetical protein
VGDGGWLVMSDDEWAALVTSSMPTDQLTTQDRKCASIRHYAIIIMSMWYFIAFYVRF